MERKEVEQGNLLSIEIEPTTHVIFVRQLQEPDSHDSDVIVIHRKKLPELISILQS